MITSYFLNKILNNKFFCDVDPEKVKKLSPDLFHPVRYHEKERIFIQGDIAGYLFLIISGKVELRKLTEDGNEVPIATAKSSDFIGEVGLMYKDKRSTSAVCISEVEGVVIEEEHFFLIQSKIPEVRENVYSNFARIIRSSSERVATETLRGNHFIEMYNSILKQKDELEKLNKELKETNEKLIESERKQKEINDQKDRFFNIVAHDLKNPLSIIISSCDLLDNYFDRIDKESLRKQIGTISKASNSLFNLLENLLEWSRSQTGRIKYKPEKVNLFNIIDSMFELCEAAADKKGIELTSYVTEKAVVYADLNMVATIFRNLISNAIKFTKKEGRITVSSDIDGDFVKLYIADSGVGIKEEDINKLFKIDSTFTTRGTENEKGTGLGLILCKEFVEKNGGTITVSSEYGKGSVFVVTLPAYS